MVRKASGDLVPYDPERIRKSLLNAGAPDQLADRIVAEVSKKVYDRMRTSDILKTALRILDKELPHIAARYDLKGAIMRLGPAGFEFEALIAEILTRYGYKTQRDVHLNGACVEHEIDIVAQRLENRREHWHMLELKYHNAPGIYTGLKETMYTWARFVDLQEGAKMGKGRSFDQAWLVSNTKFSDKSMQYAKCKNLVLMGWDYPHDKSLKKLLEDKNLYPITVLRRLTREDRNKMATVGLLLCEDLVEKRIQDLRRMTGIAQRRLRFLIEEAQMVLQKAPQELR